MPVFLFYGEEDYLIEEKIGQWKSKIADPSLNYELWRSAELSLEKLTSVLGTPAFFGEAKLIILREYWPAAVEQEAVCQLVKNVPPEITVVFWLTAVDRRTKLFRLIGELGEIAEFAPFAPWEQAALVNWLRQYAEQRGKKLSSDGGACLVEIVGLNLRLLTAELEKLITFVGERAQIEEADVRALALPGEREGWALLEALRQKDSAAALSIFQALRRNGAELLPLLGLITSQFRLLLQIKAAGGRQRDPQQLAKLIGGSPYFIKKTLAADSRFSLAELKGQLENLLTANLQMKTGRDQQTIMETLLVSLCGQ